MVKSFHRAGSTWPQCGVWYRWPWHSAWSTTESLLDQRYSSFVVPLVLNRPDSVNQYVNGFQSACSAFACSVPQGSVRIHLLHWGRCCSVQSQLTRMLTIKQLYSATTVTDIDTTSERLVNYILDFREWCASRRLQLNAQKTELVWFGSATNIRKMSAKTSRCRSAVKLSRHRKWCATSASILMLSWQWNILSAVLRATVSFSSADFVRSDVSLVLPSQRG